jgi:hypothetical protein
MKISEYDFGLMKAAINTVIELNPGCVERGVELGLSDTRIRWDIFWASRISRSDNWNRDYMDNHIDTALRKIIPINR